MSKEKLRVTGTRGKVRIVVCASLTAIGITACLLLPGMLCSEGNDVIAETGGTAPVSHTPDGSAAMARETSEAPALPSEAKPPETVPSSGGNDDAVAAYVETMTLREKLCQMMIVTPDAITGVSGTTVAGDVTKAALEKYPVGGLIHFSKNITGGEQIAQFNEAAQSYSKTPMFIAIDEEGGRVGRLKSALGAHSIGPMLTYEEYGEDAAAENAMTLAEVLKTYGFNTDFAPVADVWSNPANTVIGDRAYSSGFENAARLVSAAVRGFGDGGVVCALKHFPGHGDTREDSHSGAAYVNKTLDELYKNELVPFAAGIAAGADMVMAGHLIVPSVDELPATLSAALITDVLRGRLGFSGVVITDSLEMSAIAKNYGAGFVAVTAVKAGVDILLMPDSIEETLAALTAAVESGEIPEGRIDESVVRIIALKAARGIMVL